MSERIMMSKVSDSIYLMDDAHEAFGLPGHTKGSMALFHKQQRTLFTGDAIIHHIRLQLEESLPLSECLDVLNKKSRQEMTR